MSRLKKAKKSKKYKLKATLSGAVLMLSIGSVGAFGSYSYFSDKVSAKNDLVITMGKLDTSLSNGIDISLNKDKLSDTKSFSIINKGDLKQNVEIDFSGNSGGIDLDLLSCNLKMTYGGKSVKPQGYSVSTLKDLLSLQSAYIVDNNGNKVEVDQGESINVSVTVGIRSGITDDDKKTLEGKSADFNTTINAIQIDAGGVE